MAERDPIDVWAESQPRRIQVMVELLKLARDYSDPMQGPGGVKGDGDSVSLLPHDGTCHLRRGLSERERASDKPGRLRCSCSLRHFEELNRLRGLMRADARSIHWHVSEYFIRCTTRNATVWEKRKAKGGKTLSVEVRKIVYVRDKAIRLEKVRRGVSWLADHWDSKAIGEPMLPSAVLEEAA